MEWQHFIIPLFLDNLVIDTITNEKLEESTNLTKSVSNPNKNDNKILLEEQQKLLASLQQQILGTRSLEEIELIKNIIAPIKPTLDAVRNSSSHLLNTVQNVPHNKKIEPQRRLFTTKKSQKKRVLTAPTTDEGNVLALQLLNNNN